MAHTGEFALVRGLIVQADSVVFVISPDGQSVSSVSTVSDSIISVPLLWILAPLGRIEFFTTDFFEFQKIVLREFPL